MTPEDRTKSAPALRPWRQGKGKQRCPQFAPTLLAVMLVLGSLWASAPLAWAALPVPTNCQQDLGGANDPSGDGQKDLTRFCVAAGTGVFDLITKWNWDDTGLSGGNTADACSLYDTDDDGLANLAVCVTITGNPFTLQETRLFTCGDGRPENCTNPSNQIPTINTVCEVSQSSDDPFAAGDDFPQDTQAVCGVDLSDFGVGGNIRLIDACSYPSPSPTSVASDCVLFQGECTVDSDCNDQNSCTIDACVLLPGTSAKVCTHQANTGASCGNLTPGACENQDTCSALGFCQDNGVKTAGTSCADDGNVCTLDQCDGTSVSCQHPAVSNGTSCSDGNACTLADTCQAGACTGGNPVVCTALDQCHVPGSCNPATGLCTNPTAQDGTVCSDGNACTTGDQCTGGTCQGGAPLSCNDGNICTDDTCNPATGCVNSNNTAPCSDGNACTTGDQCTGGSCKGGPAPDCNDGNVCTDDSCNPATGCVNSNNTASCSDGNACTTGDQCTGGSCQGGAPLSCNDGNICTDDTCNPATGCVNSNNTASCSDGNACTTGDQCAGGQCISGGQKDCNDNNVCTNDACNTQTGACQYVNNTNPCDDNKFCTVSDACSGGQCGGSARNCSDQVACTKDTCDEVNDLCVHTPDDKLCADGDACTDNVCDPDDQTADAEGCVNTLDPTNDPLCVGDLTCRTAGFWGTHAGTEKKGSTTNITGTVLSNAIGPVSICGETIDTSTKAINALCVSPRGDQSLQLKRQLLATALNCVMITNSPVCLGVTVGATDLAALFAQCNTACVNKVGVTACINALDCFNNGGEPLADGFCKTGMCSSNGAPCNAGDLSRCHDLTATCEALPSCHEEALCSTIDTDLCFLNPGPAGSSKACNLVGKK